MAFAGAEKLLTILPTFFPCTGHLFLQSTNVGVPKPGCNQCRGLLTLTIQFFFFFMTREEIKKGSSHSFNQQGRKGRQTQEDKSVRKSWLLEKWWNFRASNCDEPRFCTKRKLLHSQLQGNSCDTVLAALPLDQKPSQLAGEVHRFGFQRHPETPWGH